MDGRDAVQGLTLVKVGVLDSNNNNNDNNTTTTATTTNSTTAIPTTTSTSNNNHNAAESSQGSGAPMRAGVTDDVVMDVIAVDHAVADVVSADVAESKVAAAAVAYTGENSVQGAWRAFSGIAMAAVVLVIIALFGVGIWMVIHGPFTLSTPRRRDNRGYR